MTAGRRTAEVALLALSFSMLAACGGRGRPRGERDGGVVTPPMRDGGPMGFDSGPPIGRDGGPMGFDSGPPIGRDGGPMGFDSGPPIVRDGGPMGFDSGPPPVRDGGGGTVPSFCTSDSQCAGLGMGALCDPASNRCFIPGSCDPSDSRLAPCPAGTTCMTTMLGTMSCTGCDGAGVTCRTGETCLPLVTPAICFGAGLPFP